MKEEILLKFALEHKKSPGLNNPNLNYEKFVKDLIKKISEPEIKNSDIYKTFEGFFDENKYKDPIQMAIQFQAGVDFLIYSTNKNV